MEKIRGERRVPFRDLTFTFGTTNRIVLEFSFVLFAFDFKGVFFRCPRMKETSNVIVERSENATSLALAYNGSLEKCTFSSSSIISSNASSSNVMTDVATVR